MDFFGNVVVEKEDDSLLAEKMKVFYHEVNNGAGGKKTELEKIDAEKNVRIFSQEFIGSGNIGHYYPKENIFVLEQNVVVNNGTSIASGEKFIYDLTKKKGNFVGKKEESSITGNGGDQRVVVIIGDDAKEQKVKKDKN